MKFLAAAVGFFGIILCLNANAADYWGRACDETPWEFDVKNEQVISSSKGCDIRSSKYVRWLKFVHTHGAHDVARCAARQIQTSFNNGYAVYFNGKLDRVTTDLHEAKKLCDTFRSLQSESRLLEAPAHSPDVEKSSLDAGTST